MIMSPSGTLSENPYLSASGGLSSSLVAAMYELPLAQGSRHKAHGRG
jgi:hypothetical protein